MNALGVMADTTIGINLWFAPQISLHCPVRIPGRLINKISWLIRPGTASTFIPREGMVHEWITSSDVTSIRMEDRMGRIK